MLARLWERFGADLAVDLGTANTRIGLAGHGIVVDEPSVVAVEPEVRRVLARGAAVGQLARQIEGRTADSISVVRPMRAGVIADFELCEAMLRWLMRKAQRPGLRLPPRVVVGLPGGVTPVERRAVFNTLSRAGARRVWAMSQAKAAALGAGLPIGEPIANMVCDIGAGTAEIALLSLGDIVASRSIRMGGDAFDQAIVDDLRRRHHVRVALPSAERLRLAIGSAMLSHGACPDFRERENGTLPLGAEGDRHMSQAEIGGSDSNTGLPVRRTVSAAEVREALAEPLLKILEATKETIDGCSSELAADLTERGLVLTGGGSRLVGLDRFLSEGTGLPVRLAAEPETAVVRGLLVCVEQLDAWKPALMTAEDE